MTYGQIAIRRLILVTAMLFAARSVFAADPALFSSQQIEFFETKVRPILATTCQRCHGGEKQKGGLRLDSREAVLKGGDSGAAIVPGKPEESPMIEAIRYQGLEMPPTGKLKDREIAALVDWVKMGAPWPKEKAPSAGARRAEFTITDEDRRYWAFQPVGHPQIPKVKRTDWSVNPIDAYVLHRLEAKGLEPNSPADPRTLIRRVFFDLIGLPPTPQEVDAFVADHSEAAYERIVDDLLARKQYGERWARHWLDVARYAQTNGYERDGEKPEAWRYRDYVIDSFNNDKPYNRFVLEQLAGDELDEPTNESIIATGFYRLGIWDDEPDNPKAAVWDELDEIVRTTGSAFLGLTIGCARCHNHMFDPIPQEDYYRLTAFFRNVEPYGVQISTTHRKMNDAGILTPMTSPESFTAWKSRQGELTHELDAVKAKRDALRKKLIARYRARHAGTKGIDKKELERELTDTERSEKKQLDERIAQLEKERSNPPFPQALSVRECGEPLKETHLLIRGNAATPGKKVEPQLLTVLGGKRPKAIPVSFAAAAHQAQDKSEKSLRPILGELGLKPTLGLRRELAKWIADEQNPLTPRVIMNRLWQGHFGRGIVRSSDNFGRAGVPPTHPELLAWLAREFIEGGWCLKRMHRLIVLSNTYRMSSDAANAKARAIDADNDLFWRQNLRRLDAEAIRDSILAVSGRLNLKMGGPGVYPKLAQEVLETESRPGFGWGKSTPEEESRRSVYIYLKRTLMVPFLETFDYTNTAESLGDRPVTTVAPQALLLLNSQFTFEQAVALAKRVRDEVGSDSKAQIERIFRITLCRKPTEKEFEIAERMLARPVSSSGGAKTAPDPLRSLCLIVLNLNEFIYVD